MPRPSIEASRVLFPVGSRKAAIASTVAIIAILTVLLFSVRQNILTYDNNLETIYFILITVIGYGIGSWLILGYVNRASMNIQTRRNPFIRVLHFAVVLTQFSLLGVMLFVIFDRNSEYLMSYVNAITSVFAITIMSVFGFKLIKWYKSSNRSLAVLLYSITAVTLAIMIASDLAVKPMVTIVIEESPPGEVSREKVWYKDIPEGELVKQDIEPDFTKSYIVPTQFLLAWELLNQWPGFVSFFSRWGVTSVTLHHYNHNRRIRPVILWALVSIPMIIFFVGKLPDLLDVTPEPWTRPLLRGGNIAIGIMFGISFFLMARKIPAIKDYLTIAAIGVMIISVSFSVSNLQQTFGIAGHSLILLSSYLFAVGLYYSAISISHDEALRQSIRKTAEEETSVLGSISSAQTKHEIEQKVITIAKEHSGKIADQSGVQPSFEEGDMQQYLQQVLAEIGEGSSARSGSKDSMAA